MTTIQLQEKEKNSSVLGACSTGATSIFTTIPNKGNGNNGGNNNKQAHTIPADILDDLASRFIINSPIDERNNLIRLCFQIELAHWFYLDFFCEIEERKSVPCGIKQFTMHLFQHIPFFRKHLLGIDKILEDWKEYKLSVPTYGAILISEDLNHVLLVQSYWAKSSWGFPKGKINENEDPVHCATREVYEETGYDITGLIVPKDYIEAVINYQYTRLYIIRNVSYKTKFSPRTRKEIKCCEWFPLDSLPVNKNDALCKLQLGINANSFFMIMPFMKRLKKWIHDNRSGIEHKFSLSPITTFNNSEQYAYNGNYNNGNKNCSKKNGDQKQLDKKENLTSNNNDNDYNIKYNSIALKNNSNTKINNNNNNNKRQRHKSMGDIDAIKLININDDSNATNIMTRSHYNQYTNNNISNNNTKYASNNFNAQAIQNRDECFFVDNSIKINSMSKKQYSLQQPTFITTSSTPKSASNFKRQLFHCVSTDDSKNKKQIPANNFLDAIIKKDNKNHLNSNDAIKIDRKEPNYETTTKINHNAKNKARKKLLNQSQHQNHFNFGNISNLRGKTSNQSELQQINYSDNQCSVSNNNNNNILNEEYKRNSTLLKSNVKLQLGNQMHTEDKVPNQAQQLQPQLISEKFNPNFDSWTNFSFTKNLIANVFC